MDKKLVRAMRLDPSPEAARALLDYLSEHGDEGQRLQTLVERNLFALLRRAAAAAEHRPALVEELDRHILVALSRRSWVIVRLHVRGYGPAAWSLLSEPRGDAWFLAKARREASMMLEGLGRLRAQPPTGDYSDYHREVERRNRERLVDALSARLLD